MWRSVQNPFYTLHLSNISIDSQLGAIIRNATLFLKNIKILAAKGNTILNKEGSVVYLDEK
ncbi:MAG: hypothetical protein NTX05_02365 [Fusobacteria bacterium]|nr:hypothetical protein [Fusobacteriota bacterium]